MTILVKTLPLNQFGKVTEQGVHVKPDSSFDLHRALDDAQKDGFTTIYAYVRLSSRALRLFLADIGYGSRCVGGNVQVSRMNNGRTWAIHFEE